MSVNRLHQQSQIRGVIQGPFRGLVRSSRRLYWRKGYNVGHQGGRSRKRTGGRHIYGVTQARSGSLDPSFK